MPGIDETSLLSVVDGFYSAGCDFALWPETLKRVADVLGAEDAGLGTMGQTQIAWLIAPRTDPDYLRTYPDYQAQDIVWHEVVARGVGAAVTDAMVGERPGLRSNAYHHEWSLPQGYRAKLGSLVLAEEGWRTVIVLPARDSYSDDQVRAFKAISPHLRRAVQLNIRLARDGVGKEISTLLLEEMASGAMLVDGNCRLVFANAAAEALFQPGGGVELSDGRLFLSSSSANAALEKLVGGCARAGLGDTGGEIDLRTEDGLGRKLRLIPLRPGMPVLAPGLPVALLIEAADQSDTAMKVRLRQHYGLTPAEAAFAVEIAKGDGKHAAAARRGISYTTARTHLSRIFDKTGASRQGELVRLILANVARE